MIHLFCLVYKDICLRIKPKQGYLHLKVWNEKNKAEGCHLLLNVMQAKQFAQSILTIADQVTLTDILLSKAQKHGDLLVDFVMGAAGTVRSDQERSNADLLMHTKRREGDRENGGII